MATKRGLVAMARTSTAASDVFDMGLEDIPEEIREGWAEDQKPAKPPIVAPVETEPPAPPADNKISDAQRKRFYAIAKTTGFSDEEIKAKCLAAGFEHSADITRDKYEELCAWAKGPVA